MQAVILTGGLGTRLRPATYRIPKGLIEVGGRPFLEHLILYLKKFRIEDILLCTGYLGEMIEEYFGGGGRLGVRVNYSREFKPLGTGGALKLALPLLEDIFFLLNGDTFLPIDYAGMKDGFKRSTALALLSVFPVEGTEITPNLRVEGGEITGCSMTIQEKALTHADAGVRLFRKEAANYFPPDEAFSLERVLYPRLIEADKILAWLVRRRFYDIGTPERVKEFEEYLNEHNAKSRYPHPVNPVDPVKK